VKRGAAGEKTREEMCLQGMAAVKGSNRATGPFEGRTQSDSSPMQDAFEKEGGKVPEVVKGMIQEILK